MTTSVYSSAEAFKRMQYASKERPHDVEWIWNSRDGVTPFTVRSADGERIIQHIAWASDDYQPFWAHRGLKVGDRIFVDMTREAAEKIGDAIRARWAEKYGIYLSARWAKSLDAAGLAEATLDTKRAFAVTREKALDRYRSDFGLDAGTRHRLEAELDESPQYPDDIPPVDDWEEIIDAQVKQMCEPGQPNLVTVDEAMLDHLRRHTPLPVEAYARRS